MKRSRILGSVIGCMALLAAAAACGSDDSGGSQSGSGGSQSGSGGDGDNDIEGQKAVYVNYGGLTLDAVEQTWFKTFGEKTGAELVGDSPSDIAKVKVMVESGNVTWDVIDIDGASGANGCDSGLFKTREEMGIDVSQIDPKFLSDDCGVPIENTTTALVYNKETYGDNPPTKITDFLDTQNFPGKRLTFNYAIWGLENMELAAGTAPDAIYPYNYDVAKSAYDKIKDDLVISDSLDQMFQSVSSGDFDMCFCLTERLAVTPGVSPDKVGVVWDHAWIANDMAYALEGSKVPEVQSQFLNYLATSDAQNEFAQVIPYGVTTTGAPPDVAEDFKYWMPAFNEDATNGPAYIDYGYLSKPGVADEANSQWTAMTSG